LDDASNSSDQIDRAKSYAMYFAIIFPAMGTFYSPIAGVVMDRFGVGPVLLLMTVLVAVFGVCSVLTSAVVPLSVALALQFVTFASLVMCRSLVWLVCYSLLQKRVSPNTYGTAFGLLCAVAGLFNLLGFLFTYLSEVTFGFNFVYLNIALCAVCCGIGALMTLRHWRE
jgi:MFS family permease